MRFLKVRRMCGGGTLARSVRVAWDCRDPRRLDLRLRACRYAESRCGR